MNEYIGVKRVKGDPMSRKEYNDYRGWELSEYENGEDDGYLVEYLDGGKPNHPSHKGYISWSPKDVFERAYRPVDGMTFGLAIEALKKGFKVARKVWNGKGMWLIYVPGTPNVTPNPGSPYAEAGVPEGTDILGHIDMYTVTVNGEGRRAWLASQTDMFSEDWIIVAD